MDRIHTGFILLPCHGEVDSLTCQYSLVFLPGLVTGRMFDIGYFKLPYLFASILLVVATFLVGECTKYWQFLLCQGFAIGVRFRSFTLYLYFELLYRFHVEWYLVQQIVSLDTGSGAGGALPWA